MRRRKNDENENSKKRKCNDRCRRYCNGRCLRYMGVGACKDGNHCPFLHPYVRSGRTLLLSHLYQPPLHDLHDPQRHFQEFYKELYAKLSEYGEMRALIVCDNSNKSGRHMVGNAYVRYRTKKDASIALDNLRGTSYAGRPIEVDFSPAKRFKRFSCLDYHIDENTCQEAQECFLFHIKKLTRRPPTADHGVVLQSPQYSTDQQSRVE